MALIRKCVVHLQEKGINIDIGCKEKRYGKLIVTNQVQLDYKAAKDLLQQLKQFEDVIEKGAK